MVRLGYRRSVSRNPGTGAAPWKGLPCPRFEDQQIHPLGTGIKVFGLVTERVYPSIINRGVQNPSLPIVSATSATVFAEKLSHAVMFVVHRRVQWRFPFIVLHVYIRALSNEVRGD